MRSKKIPLVKLLPRLVLAGLLYLGAAASWIGKVVAQEIEPYEFTPLPSGTSLILGYDVYGHQTSFNATNGPTFKNSKLEVNVGVARYVHFFDIGGHSAGVQVYETFGSLSGGNVGGQRLGSAFDAQNTILSAFIWPYVNTAIKTNVSTTIFLDPPDGTYNSHSAINVGDNRWRGAVQLGLSQGVGDHFGFDIGLDAQFYADNLNGFPGGQHVSQDPTYRGAVAMSVELV